MAQERGYTRQLGTSAPVGLPQASPGAFGAGIGGTIADIGQAQHQRDLREYQLDRQQQADTEAASFNATFAKLREEADKASVDTRNGAQPGGAGHAQSMRQWYEQRAQGLTDGITDDRVRRSAVAQLQEFGTRLNAAEYQWQEGKRVGKIVTDQVTVKDTATNRAYRMSDPKAFAEEMSLGRQGIEALEGVPADIRQQLIRDNEESVSVGFFNGMIDRDPASVKRVLDTGAFDDILSGQQMERLRNGAQVQVHRNEAAAKAEAAHQLVLTKETLATERARLDTGAGKPQDWESLAAQYERIGDTSSAVTARDKGASMAAAIGHKGDNLVELDAQIADLTAKKNAGGLNQVQASTLNGLQDLRGQLNGMLGQPGGALMAYTFATGKPLAPLDPANPASLRARAVQARAAAAQYGRPSPQPITATELPTFQDLVQGGAQQRLAALATIQGFGDPQVIRAAAAQMAGEKDGTFRIASQLPLAVAREVLRGEETLRTAPKVWNDAMGASDFNKWFGPMLRAIPGDYRADVFKAAKAFYSQRAVDGGEQSYNAGRFAEAIETVLGKSGAKGGIVRTDRGIVLVPPDMDRGTFQQRLARASNGDYAAASGGRRPLWADGTGVVRGDFAKLLPTAMGDGLYGFRGKNGELIQNDQGHEYVIDIRKLGR